MVSYLFYTTSSLYLSILFPHLAPLFQPLFHWKPLVCSLYLSVFCYVQLYVLFFRVRIEVKTEFVFLYLTYFTKHNIFQVHPCCCKWQNFLLFWLSGIPLCIFTAYLHPFISSWTLQLFPYLGYCKQCCSDHWGAYLSFQIISNGFCFLQMYTQLWNCWSIW